MAGQEWPSAFAKPELRNWGPSPPRALRAAPSRPALGRTSSGSRFNGFRRPFATPIRAHPSNPWSKTPRPKPRTPRLILSPIRGSACPPAGSWFAWFAVHGPPPVSALPTSFGFLCALRASARKSWLPRLSPARRLPCAQAPKIRVAFHLTFQMLRLT